MDQVIVIPKIRFQEEIRSLSDIKKANTGSITKKEMDVGMALIKQYSSPFDISSFQDDYSKELLKIIKAKSKGKRVVVKKMKPQKASSDNLYDQLMQSLGTKKRA
jgi:DNA end-binding protein Ku